MSIENVIDIKRFNFLQKLLPVTSWVKRFLKNLKKKVLKKEALKKIAHVSITMDFIKSKEF